MTKAPKLTTTAVAISGGISFVIGVLLFLWGNSMDLEADAMEADFARDYAIYRSLELVSTQTLLFSSSGARPSMTVIRFESEVEDLRIGGELLMQLGGVAVLFACFCIFLGFVVHRENKKSASQHV